MNAQNQKPTIIINRTIPHPSTIGPGGSTNTQACAACKYQRRRCAPDCPLALYFPPNRSKEFLNTRRLFGVSNIVKTIQSLQPPSQEVAVQTMIYQANVRAADPVGGCLRLKKDLEKRIAQTEAELNYVLSQLTYLRAAASLHNDDHEAAVVQNPSFEAAMHDMIILQNDNNEINFDACGPFSNFDTGVSSSYLQKNKRVATEEVDLDVKLKPLQGVKVESKKSTQSSEKVVLKENVDEPKQPPKQEKNDLKGASAASSLFSLTNCDA